MIDNIEAVLAEFEESGGISKKNTSLIAPVILEYISAVSQMPFVHGVSVGYGARMMKEIPDGIEVYTSACLGDDQESYITLSNCIGKLLKNLLDFEIKTLTPLGVNDLEMRQYPGHKVVYLRENSQDSAAA